MLNEVLSFTAQTVSSGLLALLGTMLYEPKKQRITQTIQDFEKLEKITNETHIIATQYWSMPAHDTNLAQQIIRSRADCNNLWAHLPKFCRSRAIGIRLNQFFKEITSADFQSQNRQPNQLIISQSQEYLNALKAELLLEKPKFCLHTLLFKKF